jgi:hypothetical protein
MIKVPVALSDEARVRIKIHAPFNFIINNSLSACMIKLSKYLNKGCKISLAQATPPWFAQKQTFLIFAPLMHL